MVSVWRIRFSLLLLFPTFLLLFSLISLRRGLHTKVIDSFKRRPPPPPSPGLEQAPLPRHPIYRPKASDELAPPVVDNFPRAASAKSPSDLHPVPSWNRPPSRHVPENTPLFIGFTRNWPLLQQTVVSYITAGWPPEDIYVVENTGTMFANRDARLTLQNPFYLDYHRMTNVFGVKVLSTPTLLTFAQLQNFYLHAALKNNWGHYFWSHMDVIALAAEDLPDQPHKSLYMRAVDRLRESMQSGYLVGDDGRPSKWAIHFFAYDRLALVNTTAYEEVGGWDTMIPYYGTDCDMHERLYMAGYKTPVADAGLIYDVGDTFANLEILYRRKRRFLPEEPPVAGNPTEEVKQVPKRGLDSLLRLVGPASDEEDDLNSSYWREIRDACNDLSALKNNGDVGPRNRWQTRQAGGQGELYYRDPKGFEKALQMTIEFGRTVMDEKWGHRGCNLRDVGLGAGDAWKVEHDWDRGMGEKR